MSGTILLIDNIKKFVPVAYARVVASNKSTDQLLDISPRIRIASVLSNIQLSDVIAIPGMMQTITQAYENGFPDTLSDITDHKLDEVVRSIIDVDVNVNIPGYPLVGLMPHIDTSIYVEYTSNQSEICLPVVVKLFYDGNYYNAAISGLGYLGNFNANSCIPSLVMSELLRGLSDWFSVNTVRS